MLRGGQRRRPAGTARSHVEVLLLPCGGAAPDGGHAGPRVREGAGLDELRDAEAAVALVGVLLGGVDAPVDDEHGALRVGDDELLGRGGVRGHGVQRVCVGDCEGQGLRAAGRRARARARVVRGVRRCPGLVVRGRQVPEEQDLVVCGARKHQGRVGPTHGGLCAPDTEAR